MEFKYQYKDENERNYLLESNKGKYLVSEQILFEGNFLVFSDVKPVEVEIEELKQENKLLKAQNNATSERADFIEDVVAEMAIQVYQ